MHQSFKHLTLGLLLAVAAAAASAQTTSTVLTPFSYKEAEAQFRKTINPDGQTSQCGYVQADARYKAKQTAPDIAVELDDVLIVKYQGRLVTLKNIKYGKRRIDYADKASGLRISINLIKQYNRREYGESEDRHADLTVTTANGSQRIKVVGWDCGI